MKVINGPKRKTLSISNIHERVLVGSNGCWIWQQNVDMNGYGEVTLHSKKMNAQRASWIIHKGEIPSGLHVLHTCDVRSCVNPAHLFLGDHKENMQDMDTKGRRVSVKGEDVGGAKLTHEKVRVIKELLRSAALTHSAIGEMFGVSKSCISYINRGKTWRWI